MKLSGFGLTQFDGAVHAQQDVVALDVSVDHLVRVEELQRLQTLKRKKKKRQKETVNTTNLAKGHVAHIQIQQRRGQNEAALTSLHTAAIWASSMQVSVTTSVKDPPARYSITTQSSSPTR